MPVLEQTPDFKSAKIIAICQKNHLSILRLMNPPVEREPKPDRPLSLVAEYDVKAKIKPENIKALVKELEAALERKVTIMNLEDMSRHARFTAISNSKVVYA